MKDIYRRNPVDETASRVISGGEHYDTKSNPDAYEYDAPIPTRPAPKQVEDFTGQRKGRLTVIGWSHRHKKRWVVRCDCGIYGVRTTRALRNPKNIADRCSKCERVARIKQRYIWITQGRHVPVEEL